MFIREKMTTLREMDPGKFLSLYGEGGHETEDGWTVFYNDGEIRWGAFGSPESIVPRPPEEASDLRWPENAAKVKGY